MAELGAAIAVGRMKERGIRALIHGDSNEES
jgi:hypothetical protein